MPLSPIHREERDSFDYKKMTLDVLPNFLQLLPRITIQRAGTPWPQTMPPTNLRHHGCVEGNNYVLLIWKGVKRSQYILFDLSKEFVVSMIQCVVQSYQWVCGVLACRDG